MNLGHGERRKEIRYPMEAKAVVRKSTGETVAATATNISRSGMLIQVEQPSGFALHDEITVDVELEGHPDKGLSAWGLGMVVRIEGDCVGISVCGGVFDQE